MRTLPIVLTDSRCYISTHPNHQKLQRQHGWSTSLGEWHPQLVVSQSLFGAGGAATIRACEAQYGFFVWATEFSNVHAKFSFEEPRITIDGDEWAGSEAYYQAQKSFGTPDYETVKRLMQNAAPMQAYYIGGSHALRSDWEQVKDQVMAKAVLAKFTQNESLKELLLSTGEHPLVQVKRGDRHWGTGSNSNGKNMLGVLLMELRTALRSGSKTYRGLII